MHICYVRDEINSLVTMVYVQYYCLVLCCTPKGVCLEFSSPFMYGAKCPRNFYFWVATGTVAEKGKGVVLGAGFWNE